MSVRNVSFKFDSRIISNIGEQSVSDKIAALTEIIKNSYDADAHNVYVTFRKNQILIQDDGHGITEDDIIERYLVVATGIKEIEILTPKMKRRVTGEKGMGRFAAQKLGSEIRIISSPDSDTSKKISGVIRKNNEKAIDLMIDWNKYGQPGMLASEIKLPLRTYEREKVSFSQGTQISITSLREKWNDQSIDKFKISVSQFLSPSKLEDPKESFKVFIYSQLNAKEILDKPTDEQNFIQVESSKLKNSTISMHCKIRKFKANYEIHEAGKRIFGTKDIEDKRTFGIDSTNPKAGSTKTTFKEIDIIPSILESSGADSSDNDYQAWTQDEFVGDFDFDIHFWPKGEGYWGQKSKEMLSQLMNKKPKEIDEWLSDSHGIKIYKNGVKVRPYGEVKSIQEDWLELSAKSFKEGSTRGVTFRNERIIGIVDLTSENNPNIIETTTRERLIENMEYSSLVKTLELLIEEFKKYLKLKTREAEDEKVKRHGERVIHEQAFVKTAKSVIQQTKKLEKQLVDKLDNPEILGGIKSIQEDVKWMDRASREIQQKRAMDQEDAETWNSIMRSYSAFGSYTVNSFHDITTPIESAYNWFIGFEKKKLREYSPEDLDEFDIDISKHIMSMDIATDFTTMLKQFTESTAFRKDKIPKVITVKKESEVLVKVLSMGSSLEFDCKISPDLTVKMHKNDFFSIVSNLFSNSHKAMMFSKHETKNPKITFAAKITDEEYIFIWSDNGCGIEKEEQEEIFQPLVKGKAGKMSTLGTGLGLNIIRDAVNDYQGSITVTNLSNPTEFTIRIPKKKLE